MLSLNLENNKEKSILQMHEISLVENIIQIILEEMPKNGITKVDSLTLAVGEMQHAVPEALQFAFGIMSKDTPLEDAELIIERVPVKGHCKSCGKDFTPQDWISCCPECGKTDIEIISGKELNIVEFTGS